MIDRTLRILIILAVAALWVGGLVAFAYTHRGYSNPVYFEQVTISGPSLQPTTEQVEMWVDPQQHRELRITGNGVFRYTTLVDQNGRRMQTVQDGGDVSSQMLTGDQAQSQLDDWQQLQTGGFHGLAEYRLAHAVGPVSRVQLNGRPALLFDTSRHDNQTQRLTVWIDARTHAPIQLQVQTFEYSFTQRIVRMSRIKPDTLPEDFFALPRPRQSYWDRAVGWLQRLVGVHAGS